MHLYMETQVCRSVLCSTIDLQNASKVDMYHMSQDPLGDSVGPFGFLRAQQRLVVLFL